MRATGLCVRHGTQQVLDRVSLAIEPGEVLALVGPNGAGKSTLLRALAGDLVPRSGEVTLGGRELARWDRTALARSRAVLPQHDALRFALSVNDVVRLGRAPWSRPRDPRRDALAIERALRATGVEAVAARSYPTLSGGERQRVQLARVLAQLDPWEVREEPRVLLLDEPVSSLDPAQQHHVLELAREVAHAGVGVAVVLHDLNLAAQYADRIALLHAGRLVALGRPGTVLTVRHVREVFGLSVRVLPHPCLHCPLLVPDPAGDRSTPVRDLVTIS